MDRDGLLESKLNELWDSYGLTSFRKGIVTAFVQVILNFFIKLNLKPSYVMVNVD